MPIMTKLYQGGGGMPGGFPGGPGGDDGSSGPGSGSSGPSSSSKPSEGPKIEEVD